MSNWEWKKLGDVCEIKCGATPLKSNCSFWDNGNVPWFTVDDIRNQGRIITETQKKVTEKALKKLTLFPKDTVLLCCTASVGEYALAKIPVTCNQQFNGLIIKNKDYLYFGFLFYFSSTLKEKLLSLSGKTTIDFVSNSKIRELLIPIPPLAEQKRIVKTLDEKFAKIDKLKTAAETNLKNIKECFYAELSSYFNVENEKFSKKWKQGKLGDVCSIHGRIGWQGLTKKEHRRTGDYLLITGVNFTNNNTVDYDSCVYVDKERYIQDPNIQVRKNDLLITKDGTLGKLALITENPPKPATLNGGLFVIRNADNTIYPKFLMNVMKSNSFRKRIEKSITGSTVPHLTQNVLVNFPIPLPPFSEQKRIVAHLDKLSEKVKRLEENYRRTIADCEELKKSILKKTFEGDSRSSRE